MAGQPRADLSSSAHRYSVQVSLCCTSVVTFADRDVMDGWKGLSGSCCPQLPCESVQRQLDKNPSYSILGSWTNCGGDTEIVGGENSVERRE